MAEIPENPLLRLDAPTRGARKARGPRFVPSRQFTLRQQRGSDAARQFRRLGEMLDQNRDPLEFRADAQGLAPERLLVFELTGDVANFARAAARVPGLEFIGAEDIEPDDEDQNPVFYLLIPDMAALRQLLSLWRNWLGDRALPAGFAPWRNLFLQLRAIRPWGPQDRVSAEDLEVLGREHADERGRVRLEIELVFRANGQPVEAAARQAVQAVGGEVISQTRIEGAGYHALLVSVPQQELLRVRTRGNEGLVAEESIFHIRPQSVSQISVFDIQEDKQIGPSNLPTGDPIAAIFDAVPLGGHPQLDGRLTIDDIFNLEPLAVGRRIHGTAMASAVLHGDLNDVPMPALDRRIYFVNAMYASGLPGQEEQFPGRLPADMFHEAIVRMKEGGNPRAPGVIIVNASLGDRNKPFNGQMSGWARVLDYLAFRYGILFVVSAGNQLGDLETPTMNTTEFEALLPEEKARIALIASGQSLATRRILAPAESFNALTVGGLHGDLHPAAGNLPASIFDVWANTGMCNVSSALGPGYGGSTKPDILAVGGRHHVRLGPAGGGHRLAPLGAGANVFGGVRVAVPPAPPNTAMTGRTVGTSVAAALTTGIAIRSHEILEATYEDFVQIPATQRALLMKALLVHCARWTTARDLIVDVLGPPDAKQHVRQKDNVRRYLGNGAIDANIALSCAADRATLWAVGNLARDQGHVFSIPLPAALSGKPQLHELSATVSWFAPPRLGSVNYRGARLRLLEPADLTSLGVTASKEQPDTNQTHRGTVIHRRWTGAKAAALAHDANVSVIVQGTRRIRFSNSVRYRCNHQYVGRRRHLCSGPCPSCNQAQGPRSCVSTKHGLVRQTWIGARSVIGRPVLARTGLNPVNQAPTSEASRSMLDYVSLLPQMLPKRPVAMLPSKQKYR
jgi:Subtilase family